MNSLLAGNFPNYLEWIRANGDPSAQRLLFGVMPAYPIFMFSGIILVIGLAIFNLKRRGIPLRDFELAILITIPLGILGASILGKMFIPNMIWYHVFFFWEPGMSLFGSLLFGTLSGIAWFRYRAPATHISLWVYADCIIPNLLLGQMLGRWGNFYNHEILGNITSYENLKWLPDFIRNQLFYFPNLNGFKLEANWWELDKIDQALKVIAASGPFKGLSLETVLTAVVDPANPGSWLVVNGKPINPNVIPYGTILYRQPLFLIEGIGNLVLWVTIRFGIGNWTYWFSRPKPWNLQPKAYPGRFNRTYRALNVKDLENHQTQLPVRYYHPRQTPTLVAMTRRQAWNKAYYWYEPELLRVDALNELQRQKQNRQLLVRQKQAKTKNNLITRANAQVSTTIRGNLMGVQLEALHNPFKYRIVRCGVASSSYLIGYLTLRIILETQRTTAELMVPHHPIITFILLSLLLILGILLLVTAQWIAPYRYRETGWLYEKSY